MLDGEQLQEFVLAHRSYFRACGAAVLAARDTGATLSGYARDRAGAGVASTSVELRLEEPPNTLFSARTDDDGKFRFTALPAGTYTLKLTRIGFRPLGVRPIQLSSGEQKVLLPLRIDAAGSCGFGRPTVEYLQFLPAGRDTGSLSGVVERDDGHPLASARVKLLCDERKVCGETKTDSNGQFTFFNLAPRDDITIRITHAGFYDWEESDYEMRAGFDSSYRPIPLAPRLRPKTPLVVCE
jgi:hypothetical protein